MNLIKKLKPHSLITTIAILFICFLPDNVFAQAQNEGMSMIGSFIWDLVVAVFGNLAGAAGALLDYSVTEYVVGFGEGYEKAGSWGAAIDSSWVSIRDFFNISFIFGLVYIGFKMILNSDDSQTRTWLIHLIMAALLVNFSLYITKFVIDVSNVLATEIALSFYDPTVSGGEGKTEVHISDTFMNSMGVTTLFGDSVIKDMNSDSELGLIFGTLIIFVVMIFTFGAGALLLTIRFAVLLLYMVFSPFMFIGWVFPQLSRYTNQFWSGFLGRAFFAPIYLLLLYVSVQIIQGAFNIGLLENGQQAILGVMTGTGEDRIESVQSMNGLPVFLISSIFLIASVVIAQKMGANGGTAAVNAGKNFSNRVKKRATSMTKSTARFAATPVTAPARLASNKLGTSLDRGLTNFQAKERTSGLGKAVGAMSKFNSVDRAVRGTASALEKNKMGTGRTREEDLLYKQNTENRAEQQKTIRAAEEKIGNADEENPLAGTAKTVDELEEAFKNLSDTMRKMSKDEKMNLGYDKLTKESYAINLRDSDIEHFEKSGKFSSQQIQTIKDKRKKAIMRTINSGSVANNSNANNAGFIDTQRANLFRGNVNDIAKMPTDVFTHEESYKHLSPAMVEAKLKEGVSQSELTKMRNALTEFLGQDSTSPGDAKVWNKWEDSNSIHAAKFFS